MRPRHRRHAPGGLSSLLEVGLADNHLTDVSALADHDLEVLFVVGNEDLDWPLDGADHADDADVRGPDWPTEAVARH